MNTKAGKFTLGDYMKVGRWSQKTVNSKVKKEDGTAKTVCVVSKPTQWRPVGAGEITIDGAAEESVCPKYWGEAYEMKKPTKKMRFLNASGGEMGHYGEKVATFRAGGREKVMSLGFQVSDVQKPLAAAWKIAEKGNIVQFGPQQEDNFIQKVETGKKIQTGIQNRV